MKNLSVEVVIGESSRAGRSEKVDQVVLNLFLEGHEAASVSLIRIFKNGEATDAFESHSFAQEKFRERGLGSLAYLLAAKFAQENLGATVYSALDPSPAARRTWNRMVTAAWAEQLTDPYWTAGERSAFATSPGVRYRFKKEFLNESAFAELSTLLDKPQIKLNN